MSKIQYIALGAIGVVILLTVVGFVYIFGGLAPSSPSQNTDGQSPFPNTRPAINSSPQGISASSRKDILKDPDTKADPNNPGHYFVGNYIDSTIDAPPTVPYAIEYIAASDYFSVALLKEPLSSSRATAEQYLMQRLGVTQDDMCRLKYMVSAPAWVNTTYASTNFGFSFCPGATVLP